nr:MAG TPA: hypothetical protein [Caudoviricetes sp.]
MSPDLPYSIKSEVKKCRLFTKNLLTLNVVHATIRQAKD